MSGIYIHIPFCKQACHYCDFHFSTSLKKKSAMITAICDEIVLRKNELTDPIETIYFGGGTPSLLASEELAQIFTTIEKTFQISENPEITLEANPDDISEETIKTLVNSPINRVSLGIQSFFDDDLRFMNRSHNASEAIKSINLVKHHFENCSIDLIYGVPGMTVARWTQNIDTALELDIPHLSCYALTVEPQTALDLFIKKGVVAPLNEEEAKCHHDILTNKLGAAGYENYEFSNFGKPGFHSRNNTAYWHGKPFLGVGPSAHSYDGDTRSWNVANNAKYLKKLSEKELPVTRETLTVLDKYNEYVMTRLRTINGIELPEIKRFFGLKYETYLLQQAQDHLDSGLLERTDLDCIVVTQKGKFLSDGIASDLFLVNLD